MVKRGAHNPKTVIACPGSNPGSATKKYALVAQLNRAWDF